MNKKISDDLYEDDIQKTEYIGVVEDVADPKKIGRARVRVFGKTGHASGDQEISTALLPWAYPEHFGFASASGGFQYSTPKLGAEVLVHYPDGNIYAPKYSGLINLSDAVAKEIASSYENAHVFGFDEGEHLKVYYTTAGGLLLYKNGSVINITQDDRILLTYKDKSAQIEMAQNNIDIVTQGNVNVSSTNNVNINSNNVWANGVQTNLGGDPIYSNMNGEPMMELIKALATIIDAKMAVTAGTTVALVNQFEEFILSKTVKTSG